ncbi:MAG: NUDIX domain-containing protein [Candidatus Paceibacterota bacterium]
MIDEKIFEKDRNFHGVKGLIFIEDKILVYRRDNKTKSFPFYIDLPGGGKEKDESAFDTFKRESQEEFGISIEKENVIYAKKYTSAMDQSKESYFIVVKTYKTKDDVNFGDEGLEYFLLKIEEYLQLNDSIPRQKEKVEEYLKSIK